MAITGHFCHIALNTGMMTFSEYVRLREGMWLADKNAVRGLSQIDNTALLPKKRPKQRTGTPVLPRPKSLSPKVGLVSQPPNLTG